MVELYSGQPITTKSDIWALGVMLYRLCYFSLPFSESAFAIQNGNFSIPEHPPYSDKLVALIKYLLQPNQDLRPDIYQVSHLAFSLSQKKCPVGNLRGSKALSTSELILTVRSLASSGSASSSASLAEANGSSINESLGSSSESPSFVIGNNSLLNGSGQGQVGLMTSGQFAPVGPPAETTVTPRERPKRSQLPKVLPLNVTTARTAAPFKKSVCESVSNPDLKNNHQQGVVQVEAISGPGYKEPSQSMSMYGITTSAVVPQNVPECASTESYAAQPLPFSNQPSQTSAMFSGSSGPPDMSTLSSTGHALLDPQLRSPSRDSPHWRTHRRNASDTSAVNLGSRPSAFRPYQPGGSTGAVNSMPSAPAPFDFVLAPKQQNQLSINSATYQGKAHSDSQLDEDTTPTAATAGQPLLFSAAEETRYARRQTDAKSVCSGTSSGRNPFLTPDIDELSFGQKFDQLPRRGSASSTQNVKSRESLIMSETDPFGAAPFNPSVKGSGDHATRSVKVPSRQSDSKGSRYTPEFPRQTQSKGPIEKENPTVLIPPRRRKDRYAKLIDNNTTDDEKESYSTAPVVLGNRSFGEVTGDTDSIGSCSSLQQKTSDDSADQSDEANSSSDAHLGAPTEVIGRTPAGHKDSLEAQSSTSPPRPSGEAVPNPSRFYGYQPVDEPEHSSSSDDNVLERERSIGEMAPVAAESAADILERSFGHRPLLEDVEGDEMDPHESAIPSAGTPQSGSDSGTLITSPGKLTPENEYYDGSGTGCSAFVNAPLGTKTSKFSVSSCSGSALKRGVPDPKDVFGQIPFPGGKQGSGTFPMRSFKAATGGGVYKKKSSVEKALKDHFSSSATDDPSSDEEAYLAGPVSSSRSNSRGSLDSGGRGKGSSGPVSKVKMAKKLLRGSTSSAGSGLGTVDYHQQQTAFINTSFTNEESSTLNSRQRVK